MEEKFDFKELEKGLITLSGKIDTIEQMERHKGEKFNIFSILNMERKEVETHSMFLYELLNPDGSHYQGTKYLEIFVTKVLKIDDFEYKNIPIVKRETFADKRRIDFTIENDKYYIAIEMKIDAGDQDGQLDDYFVFAKEQCKKNKKLPKMYYLTLYGKEASEKSVKNEETEYETISFQSDIIEFIEKSIEKSVSLPIVRETLIQYKTLIKKITNQTTQEITIQVEKIINTPEMAKSATMMAKNLGYVWALREVKFWKALADKIEEYLEKLNDEPWVILYEPIFINESDEVIESNEEIANEIFTLGKTDSIGIYIEKNEFSLYIYIRRDSTLSFQMEGIKNLEEVGKRIGINRKYGEAKWEYANNKINFSKDYHSPTYDIFDDKKLEEIVKNVAKELEGYMDTIIQVLK